jgi:hypothetical protein
MTDNWGLLNLHCNFCQCRIKRKMNVRSKVQPLPSRCLRHEDSQQDKNKTGLKRTISSGGRRCLQLFFTATTVLSLYFVLRMVTRKQKKSQISIAKATIKLLNFGSYKVQGHSLFNIHKKVWRMSVSNRQPFFCFVARRSFDEVSSDKFD